MEHGVTPLIYYCNPNIYPEEEYLKRKDECSAYAESLGLEIVDADYDHRMWKDRMKGLENEPERGARCLECFKLRLVSAAAYAQSHGYKIMTTTLASSRWKSLAQINQAGEYAASLFDGVTWWDRNWRKDGLQERRNQLLKEHGFYNQQYCGCEFSMARLEKNHYFCGGITKKMKIGICSDHAGFDYKGQLISHLQKNGYETVDFGTDSPESMDYPDTAHPLASAVEKGEVDAGIAMCGTGNGMAMTLNKHPEIRAGLAWNTEIGELVKRHNNANILVMPARFISFDEAAAITDTWLGASFEGGRHQRRIDKIPLPSKETR